MVNHSLIIIILILTENRSLCKPFQSLSLSFDIILKNKDFVSIFRLLSIVIDNENRLPSFSINQR